MTHALRGAVRAPLSQSWNSEAHFSQARVGSLAWYPVRALRYTTNAHSDVRAIARTSELPNRYQSSTC